MLHVHAHVRQPFIHTHVQRHILLFGCVLVGAGNPFEQRLRRHGLAGELQLARVSERQCVQVFDEVLQQLNLVVEWFIECGTRGCDVRATIPSRRIGCTGLSSR